MVVSVLFTYTKPLTAAKRSEVLLLCHSLTILNWPNTVRFPPKTKTVFVGFVVGIVRKDVENPHVSSYASRPFYNLNVLLTILTRKRRLRPL